MLGNALIEADKNWHKGGYLKLLSKIEKAKARHRAIQEVVRIIPKEKQEIIYCIELENCVQINCEKINRIFQAHKDYQPIIDNILHNFNYFLENFSEIESWLLSSEFYKRYKKEKHPYPSLINPKTADYKNISAQLAWEMNLPLPENYDFIFFVDKVDNHYILNHRIKTLKRVLLEVYYIDMLDILPNKAHDTLVYLAKKFNYSPPKQNVIFERAHNSIIVNISRVFFPKVFNVYLNDKNIKINLALKNNILEDKYVNCIEEFTQSLLLLGENVGAGAYILKSDFDELRAKHEIWNKVKKYLGEYFMRLEQRYMLEQERIVFENEILDFLEMMVIEIF